MIRHTQMLNVTDRKVNVPPYVWWVWKIVCQWMVPSVLPSFTRACSHLVKQGFVRMFISIVWCG